MDTQQYIKVNSLFWFVQAIPESATGDTVSVTIKRLSDGYTWNFSTLAFVNSAQSGNMTFISDILWKQSFTPPTEDTYIVTVNDTTLDVKYVQVLKAVGAVAQAGLTGSELTTTANVKEFLGIGTAVTDDDTFIQNLITRVSDDIEKECGRTFADATYTEYRSGDSTGLLLLDQYPINSITSIHDDIDRDYGADCLIDADDYSYYSDSGIVELDGLTFCRGVNNVKIVYNAGYTTIPTDLEQACIKRVAVEYITGKAGVNAFNAENSDKIKNLKESAQDTIARYRRVR